MKRYRLLSDVTAEMVAVDSPEPGEGYPPEHIIGAKGTLVTGTGETDEAYGGIEVCDFSNDPFVVAYVDRAILEETK
jgi:hypothetical protein